MNDGLAVFLMIVLFMGFVGSAIAFATGSITFGWIAIGLALIVGLIAGNILT